MDKPSVPLKAIGDPGPPKIVEIQEKYGAVEGKQFYSSSSLISCQFFFQIKQLAVTCLLKETLHLLLNFTRYYIDIYTLPHKMECTIF